MAACAATCPVKAGRMNGLFWKKSPARKRKVRSPTCSSTTSRGLVCTPLLVARSRRVAPFLNFEADCCTRRRSSGRAALISSIAIAQCGTSTMRVRELVERKPIGPIAALRGFWKWGVIFDR